MKISKISLAILILICAVGIVAAADLSDIKVAEGFDDLGNGSYTNEAKNIEMEIITEEFKEMEDYFENDDDVKYTITPGKLNNTFNFTDGVNEMVGVNELVKIGDKKYIVEFWVDSNENDRTGEMFENSLDHRQNTS